MRGQSLLRLAAALTLLGGVVVGDAGCVKERELAIDGRQCRTSAGLSVPGIDGTLLPDKTLALTFDDGPAERTTELSNYLRDQGIHATFFVNGRWIEGYDGHPPRADVVAGVAADGHLIANHSHTHRAFTEITPDEILQEIQQTDALIAPYVPANRRYLRPPFGAWTPEIQKLLRRSAFSEYHGPIWWDIGDALTATTAADWQCWSKEGGALTVEQCGALYLTEIRAKRHGIVLMHDGAPGDINAPTIDMVKWLVPQLKTDGYSFVLVDAIPKAQERIRDTESFGTPVDPQEGHEDDTLPPPQAEVVDPCAP